jgi:hypothetical protein
MGSDSIVDASSANPTVAVMVVLTPMPCIPVTPAPWGPSVPTILLGNIAALDNTSKLICTWGGVIQVVYPGQVTKQIT